jgi:CheY-like chemotaxis protein
MNKRVLLVEDDPDTVNMMRRELALLHYDVAVAENGAEAVQLAASDPPDVIIMDIRMPKMDGLEAVAHIRNDPKTRDVPILAATAMATPGDKERCLDAGCNAYISKPFTYKDLGVAIKKLLAS